MRNALRGTEAIQSWSLSSRQNDDGNVVEGYCADTSHIPAGGSWCEGYATVSRSADLGEAFAVLREINRRIAALRAALREKEPAWQRDGSYREAVVNNVIFISQSYGSSGWGAICVHRNVVRDLITQDAAWSCYL